MDKNLEGYEVPNEVFYDERLRPPHVLLYAYIKGLNFQGDPCTYTDKELAEKMRCSVPHVKRLLKRLAEQGYIVRQQNQVGMVRSRKIFIYEKKEA